MKKRPLKTMGFSLLEMVAAAALVTGTMVPALAVIRDAMAQSRDLHRRNLLGNYVVQILEEQAAYVAFGDEPIGDPNWANALSDSPTSGDFADDGNENIRYTMTTSDNPANGGLLDQLMNIEVTVYDDANGNDSLNAGELQETYRTKVAKLSTYENEEL